MVEVVEIPAAATHQLRRVVLRDGTASDAVVFDGDELGSTWHLGARVGGTIVAISTWMVRTYPDRPAAPAHQLRGMATAPDHRRSGIGAHLLAAGVARCIELGDDLVWARARVSALGFYERHGFEPIGADYVDLATGLPHRDIIRTLR